MNIELFLNKTTHFLSTLTKPNNKEKIIFKTNKQRVRAQCINIKLNMLYNWHYNGITKMCIYY